MAGEQRDRVREYAGSLRYVTRVCGELVGGRYPFVMDGGGRT